MSRDPRLYLEDIRDCCRKVLRYAQDMTLQRPVADEKTFDAIMRNLEITGEAARQVPAEIKGRHPEVEWRSIAGFRDVAIHAHPTIDEEIVGGRRHRRLEWWHEWAQRQSAGYWSSGTGGNQWFERGGQFRYTLRSDDPDSFELHVAVLVREHVTKADDAGPGDLRMLVAEALRHPPSRLPDDFQFPFNGET